MTGWYNVKKAAQVAAFFARAQGGRINVLKLVKLIYLSDRRHLEKYDWPILFDRYVSMDHGPVNSITYNYINGAEEFDKSSWDGLLSDKANHEVGLRREISDGQLDQLSDAEIDTLNAIWNEFGGLNQWEIRDWTHTNCPEWSDPNGSSEPIPLEKILETLGKRYAADMEAELVADRSRREMFSSI